MKRAKWIRVSIYAVSVLAALTLFVGFLHTKAGRPLLARIGVGCPVQASPEAIEAARDRSARATRGVEMAASRPALGFTLEKMTLADVKAWAAAKQVSCEDKRDGLLRCTNVPAAALGSTGPDVERLDLGFTLATNQLVNINAWRKGLTSDVAATQLNAIAASMQQQLGAPTKEAGERSARYLASGPLRTAVVQYRFKDYIADLSATNIAGRGVSLREQYMSVRD